MTVNQLSKGINQPNWHIIERISQNIYLLCSTLEDHVMYAPMYIHSFRLIAPRKLLEAQTFNQKYHSYDEIPTVHERLRWCRHHMGLMQKEVAALIGIRRGYYNHLETGHIDYYPKEIMDKLAALYNVSVDDLLDDFNRFMYYGQGKLIKEHRQSLGLEKKPYARLMKIHINSFRKWESEEKRITKSSWEKYFKGVIGT